MILSRFKCKFTTDADKTNAQKDNEPPRCGCDFRSKRSRSQGYGKTGKLQARVWALRGARQPGHICRHYAKWTMSCNMRRLISTTFITRRRRARLLSVYSLGKSSSSSMTARTRKPTGKWRRVRGISTAPDGRSISDAQTT